MLDWALRDPRQHGGVRILEPAGQVGAEIVAGKRFVLGVGQGGGGGGAKLAVDQSLESTPIHPAKGRANEDVLGVGVVDIAAEQIRPRTPARAQINIHVPHHQGEFRACGTDVAVEILAGLAAINIPIADGVVDGKDPHPILHVGQVLHVGHVAGRAVGTGRIHQREDVGEIVHGIGRAPDFIHGAVAGGFLDPASCGIRQEGVRGTLA